MLVSVVCMYILVYIKIITKIYVIIYKLYHDNHSIGVMVDYLAGKYQMSTSKKDIEVCEFCRMISSYH